MSTGELHRLAARLMKGESSDHTLQATALVNEAYLKLFGRETEGAYEDKRHFIRSAARAMRSVLIDHARAKKSLKRGGDNAKIPLDDIVEALEQSASLSTLGDVMDDLSQMDPELAQLVDLRFFAGLTIEETAEVLEISSPTVERRWRVARAWLREALGSN